MRFAIEDATNNREFEHRLRDFNNLPTTGLAEVRAVLQVAIARVEARVDASASDGAVRRDRLE